MLTADNENKQKINSKGYKVLINVDGKQKLVSPTDVIIADGYTLNDLLTDVKYLKEQDAIVQKLKKSNNALCDVMKFVGGKIK